VRSHAARRRTRAARRIRAGEAPPPRVAPLPPLRARRSPRVARVDGPPPLYFVQPCGSVGEDRQLGRALVLNATFEPLCVVSARRALVLVLKHKAELVHQDGGSYHSERMTVPIPSVIRLKYFVRVPYRARATLSRR